MTELEINKTIHKVLGKCWHEWYALKELQFCSKCSKKVDNYFSADYLYPNPSYTSSWEVYINMLTLVMKQEWWSDFLKENSGYETVTSYEGLQVIFWNIPHNLILSMLNSFCGSTMIAEFLNERK